MAIPGSIVASGKLVTPGGAQGPLGAQGTPGPTVVSADAGNTAILGSDSKIYVPDPTPVIINLSSAYTLTSADKNKFVICSGGSWTLSLPAPAIGLAYYVHNDQTCFGTTGSITVQPAGGTIDGAASLVLLPQQECRLICDGNSWRTFGLKRDVVLGILDITASTASAVILLPVGFRVFELDLTNFAPVTANSLLNAQFSKDGGSTWLTGAYLTGITYAPTATTVAFSSVTTGASAGVVPQTTSAGQGKVTIYSGLSAQNPTLISTGISYRGDTGINTQYIVGSIWNGIAVANAVKLAANAGNIATLFITVRAVV